MIETGYGHNDTDGTAFDVMGFDNALVTSDYQGYHWTQYSPMYKIIEKIFTGAAKDQRVGNRIYGRFLKVNIELRPYDKDKLTHPYIRCIVAYPRDDKYDLQVNKATDSTSDPPFSYTQNALPYRFMALPNTKLVNIVEDFTIPVGGT